MVVTRRIKICAVFRAKWVMYPTCFVLRYFNWGMNLLSYTAWYIYTDLCIQTSHVWLKWNTKQLVFTHLPGQPSLSGECSMDATSLRCFRVASSRTAHVSSFRCTACVPSLYICVPSLCMWVGPEMNAIGQLHSATKLLLAQSSELSIVMWCGNIIHKRLQFNPATKTGIKVVKLSHQGPCHLTGTNSQWRAHNWPNGSSWNYI